MEPRKDSRETQGDESMLTNHPFFLIDLNSRSIMFFKKRRNYTKIIQIVWAITAVVLLVISFGAEAKKDRMDITACVCHIYTANSMTEAGTE